MTSGGSVPRSISFSSAINLRAEQLRPAAVMRERGQRVERPEVALHGAEIRLQRPEGGDHRRRHAVFGLGAREHGGVFLEVHRALLQPVGVDHAR